jgi:hypothetical protein
MLRSIGSRSGARPARLQRASWSLLALLFAAVGTAPARAEAEPKLALVELQSLVEEPGFSATLLITNAGASAVEFAAPLSVSGLVEAEAGTFAVTLLVRVEDAHTQVLPAGGFARVAYSATLPQPVDGLVRLTLVDLEVEPVWFEVTRTESADDTFRFSHPAAGPSKSGKREQKRQELIERILGGISTYEPLYFIVGGNFSPVTAKLQLSGQYRVLLEPTSESELSGFLGQAERVAHDLYLGYTQTSIWELSSPSAPFRDTSFRPAFYYWNSRFGETYSWADGPWDRLGMQIGFEHESNGQSGDDSRSMNIAFIRPVFTLGGEKVWHFTIAPKIYAYIDKSDNSDIPDYRGYVDLLLKVGRLEGVELTATLRKGVKKGYGSAQFDLTYPIALLARRLGAFLQVQYFYGYGDTLLGYDDNAHSQARAGIMIVPYGAFFR